MIYFYEEIGKMTIKQEEKVFKLSIRKGNCLAVFNYYYKDSKTGEDMVMLWNFFADKKHVDNIIKNEGKLFRDKITSIELNMYYKECATLLNIFVKQGYKVKAYYKEPKENKKSNNK